MGSLGHAPRELRGHASDEDAANEGLFYIMVEKTKGDAALRVNSVTPGKGVEAYMRIYLSCGWRLSAAATVVLQYSFDLQG